MQLLKKGLKIYHTQRNQKKRKSNTKKISKRHLTKKTKTIIGRQKDEENQDISYSKGVDTLDIKETNDKEHSKVKAQLEVNKSKRRSKTVFSCKHCEDKFSKITQLTNHMKVCHTKDNMQNSGNALTVNSPFEGVLLNFKPKIGDCVLS